MKISYLTPRFKPSIGGIETLVYETSKYVLSKKNTVKVFTSKLTGKYDQRLKKMEYINGIQVHWSFAFPLLPIKGGMVNIMPKMLIDVLRDNADIYHSFGVGTFPSIMGYLKKMKNYFVLK